MPAVPSVVAQPVRHDRAFAPKVFERKDAVRSAVVEGCVPRSKFLLIVLEPRIDILRLDRSDAEVVALQRNSECLAGFWPMYAVRRCLLGVWVTTLVFDGLHHGV